VLGKSYKGLNLQHIFRTIHSQIAIVIHQATNCQKPVWWNYWDYCPRSEADYMIRLNYLLNNPIKHGYVNRLQDYSFSSFSLSFDQIGQAQLVKQFQAYSEYKSLTLSEAEMDDF
jgi:putative transposase